MDIIVVSQPDESYKISPFRIRFGSFRVFKAKEKIVNILINGQKTELTMRLSECGEAYFMHEIHRVVQDNNYLSDNYSPVETGNSAPSSPVIKANPLNPLESAKLNEIEILNLDETEKQTKEAENTPNTVNTVNTITLLEEDTKELAYNAECELKFDKVSSNLEFLIDRSELEEKRMRKMSFDVMSRDESYYKFRMIRESTFSIQASKRSNPFSVELSNSWNLLSKAKDNIETVFLDNKISKEEFFKDPWKVLNSGNLAVKFEDLIYTWKVIAPIIFSQLAFGEDLPANAITSLTQQQEGFFLWRKLNLDAFRIDIKKRKEDERIKLQEEKLSTEKKEGVKAKSGTSTPIKPIKAERKTSIQYRKTYTLSSDQIKSLYLKKGKNEISFVVSSRYQGTHMLTSDIYLWDWEDKIVISDLDGTITRSDVLGHFLPLFGKDWSHKGVVKLFNKIYANDYKLLYLTARSISQSEQTKNYLRNKLTQNNMKLPDGPILTSPDGLVSSFKREVIDRIPQSFKIECLTQIVNLFPPESKPFFAGFGNRHTDAISYEVVGISRNKIFLINEKGEITQYNHYYKTSYVNINEQVNEMFPAVKCNNTFYGSVNYFKPSSSNLDVNKVFD